MVIVGFGAIFKTAIYFLMDILSIKMNCSFYIFRAQVTERFKFLAPLFKPTTKITLEFILIDFVSTVSHLM